jgi:hypothetical protein
MRANGLGEPVDVAGWRCAPAGLGVGRDVVVEQCRAVPGGYPRFGADAPPAALLLEPDRVLVRLDDVERRMQAPRRCFGAGRIE